MADNPNVAGPDAATPSRAMTSAPASFPPAAVSPGVPAPMGAAGAPAALKPAPAKRAGLRRFIVPVLILAALGYGGKTAYEWFVEGRFLVSTDDAYVGANTSIIAAKAMGHLTAVPVVDNQVVHKGDLLASIDDGDYQNAVELGESAHRHARRHDRSLRPADRRPGRDHRPGRGASRLCGGAGRRAPRPTSSGPRWNTTAPTSSRRRISARSSAWSRRPPIATAPPQRLPPPRRAKPRRPRLSWAQRPISTCSRRSKTRLRGSAPSS